MTKYIEIPHIGEVLNEEFLQPLNLSQNKLAIAVGVPSNRINNIVNAKLGITADTDLRLTKYFGLSKGYFLRMQDNFELLRNEREIEKELAQIIPFAQIQKRQNNIQNHNKKIAL
jgi:addiction module HigA family antidote